MHTVTLLIGRTEDENYDPQGTAFSREPGTAEFSGYDDLLRPTKEQIPAITKFELQDVPRDRISHAIDYLHSCAFHEGFKTENTVSVVLVDGWHGHIPKNFHFPEIQPQPYS